jgi:transposase
MDATPEVLIGRIAARRRLRDWPNEVKARIVTETLKPGVKMNAVALRHGLRANHLSSWRTLARQGKPVLPAPEDAVDFAAMIVAPPEALNVPPATVRPEIMVGAVTIHLEPGAPAERIAAVVRALAAISSVTRTSTHASSVQ